MPPLGESIGDAELNIRVNGLDLIRGRSGNGSGGGEKDKVLDLVRGGYVGRDIDKAGEARCVDGRGSGGGGGGGSGGGPTDGMRGGEDSIAGKRGILADMRVLICSSSPSRIQITKWITEMGGSVLSPMHYKFCTHICLEAEDADCGEGYVWHRDNKKIISKSWIKQAYDTNRMPDNDEAPSRTGCPRANLSKGRVERTLCFDENEEDIFRKNHQLFLCKADATAWTSLTEYAQTVRKTLVKTVETPGSSPEHQSMTTNPEVKAAIKEVYVLIKSVNKAGYSISGQFTADNFVIDKGKGQINVRFAGIHTEALKNFNPDNEYLDILGFKKMIRREFFQSQVVPHDINVWLFLIGKKECEDLIPHHIYLLDEQAWTEPFMTWYDIWQNLKSSDNEKYSQVLGDLKAYQGWKAVIQGKEKNKFLDLTLNFVNPHSMKKIDYEDNAEGLIHLLRNCRHHQAIKHLRFFALIASQFFPNLISDFQLAMVKARCIKLPA